jgi:GNAT superfamily N-acetyltransferase
MIDLREYENLARETGAYKDIELEILKETITDWQKKPGDPYTILELRDGKFLAGFAVMCRESGTDYTFCVRAFCVEPSYLRKGVASNIIDMLEEEILRLESSAILRFETSSSKEAAIGAGVLADRAYALIGHIPDFYVVRDDYFMYAKHLRRGPVKVAAGVVADAAAGDTATATGETVSEKE